MFNFKMFLKDASPFYGATDTPVFNLMIQCKGILRFTSGATPADLLAVSIVLELF